MKLVLLVVVWVAAGLAVHGVGKQVDQSPGLQNITCPNCNCEFAGLDDGHRELDRPRWSRAPKPGRYQNSMQQAPPRHVGVGHRKTDFGSGSWSVPDTSNVNCPVVDPGSPCLTDSQPSAPPAVAADRVVEEILQIRASLGGSTVAEIMGDVPDPEMNHGDPFRQAVSRLVAPPSEPRELAGPDSGDPKRGADESIRTVLQLRLLALDLRRSHCPVLQARAARYARLCDELAGMLADERAPLDSRQAWLPKSEQSH